MTKQHRIDIIYEKLNDIRFDVTEKINDLINVKWDSPTLKKEIEALTSKGFKLFAELEKLEKK